MRDAVNSLADVNLKLLALLDEHREELADAWLEAILREMPDARYSQRPSEEIRSNNLTGLAMLKELLQGAAPDTAWELRSDSEAAAEYIDLGIDVSELAMAVLLLEDVAHPLVRGAFSPYSAEGRQTCLQLRRHVHLLAQETARGYYDLIRQRLREEERRTSLLLEITRTASGSLDLDKVLRSAARGIATAVEAQHCLILLASDDAESGVLWAMTDELPPTAAERLRDRIARERPLPEQSLVRLVMEGKQPLACYDAQADPRADVESTTSAGIRSMLQVPFVHREQVLGVAIVVTFDERREFAEEQIALASGLASAVAPAIDNARLYQRVEELAVLEERSRLAREIHDDVAQVLGALQLRVWLLDNLLSGDKVAEARDSLPEVQDLVSKAYSELRESVFDLRAMAHPASDFLPALQEYLADYRQHYELDVSLETGAEAAAMLDGSTGVQVIRIIQEALTNARRHARASRAWVRIYWLEGCLFVSVEDNGQGFDPSDRPADGQSHFGLQVMRERAEKVGGHLIVDSGPGGGTRVLLRLPN